MADNTEEEHKDHLADSEAENPLKDVPASDLETETPDQTTENTEKPADTGIPASDTEKIIPNQESENMEIHHHGHHHHKHHEGKRSRKSYFWEFLMLFLAVLCGSLAEYGLEHKIENDREKVFIKTMISDLEEDTALLAESIIKYLNKRELK